MPEFQFYNSLFTCSLFVLEGFEKLVPYVGEYTEVLLHLFVVHLMKTNQPPEGREDVQPVIRDVKRIMQVVMKVTHCKHLGDQDETSRETDNSEDSCKDGSEQEWDTRDQKNLC